uniref:Uncharacterized protein n=1 Tax=Alexandrium monilatum TaxID=311494 RepID=A0A7S4QEA7_9DINO
MPEAVKDPCASFRDGRRGISRACYAALWLAQCSTQRWKEHWQHLGQRTRRMTIEDANLDINGHKPFSCRGREMNSDTCGWLSAFLDAAVVQLFIAALPKFSAERPPDGLERDAYGDNILDLADASRVACKYQHVMLKILFQRVPELFANATLNRAIHRRLLKGVPYEALKDLLLSAPPHELLVGERAGFAALRAASEVPFGRLLWPHGVSMDNCAVVGFLSPICRGYFGSGEPLNTTLLVSFYRHKDPGLPSTLAEQLTKSKDPRLRISGWLAMADRRRNLGSEYAEALDAAFSEFRRALFAQQVSMETMIPSHGPPTHLVWHYLDKLSLPLSVLVPVQTRKGATSEPHLPRLEMSVLPDRDLISDHVRNTHNFHCPGSFMDLLTHEAEARPGELLWVVEVGGFLGDCLLWAAGWLGPQRLRALEVEPVAGATSRLQQTLARNGLSDAVSVRTEAMGDGKYHDVGSLHICSRKRPSHPNFSVLQHILPKAPAEPDTRPVEGQCKQWLRALDDVLEEWPALPREGSIDIVRVKAAGSEPLIVAGLARHLAGGTFSSTG